MTDPISKLSPVPPVRIHAANDAPVRGDRACILYWMISARRLTWNHALDRAVAWSRELNKPLLLLEPLRVAYPFASDRLHRFVLEGMADNAARAAERGVRYFPYVEPEPGAGKGLLEALAVQACVVVTDSYPTFFLPRMVEAAARKLDVRLEAVEGGGLMPLRATPRAFPTAHSFRRFLQKELPRHLDGAPSPDALRGPMPEPPALPPSITKRWPAVDARSFAELDALLAKLPIDHQVLPAAERGGTSAAERVLQRFLEERVDRYPDRSHPDDASASGLSPWLHFGHLSPHQVFAELAERHEWSASAIHPKAGGSREGFWNMSPAADAFLDELITWRELGRVRCHHSDDYARYEGLPAWARATLEEHLSDPRPQIYSLEQLEAAQTYDPVWNAAQRELRQEGRIQNYMRMVWGKRLLEWTAHPRQAFELLVHLNDKYALDGRDPASYSNIAWVFGAYDRAWGPERPIYGKVRYMSSDNALKKLRAKRWLARFSGDAEQQPLF